MKNNIHNRTEQDIRKAMNEWMPTPSSYTLLDYECLFNSADNTDEISDADEEQDDSDEVLDTISDDEHMHAENDLDDLSGEEEAMNEVNYIFFGVDCSFSNFAVLWIDFNPIWGDQLVKMCRTHFFFLL